MKTKVISVVLTVCLLLGISSLTAYAEAPDSDFRDLTPEELQVLSLTEIGTFSTLPIQKLSLTKSNGDLLVYYTTIANQVCSEIGIHDLKLQKQTWYGTWQTIRTTQPVTYNSDSCTGGYYYLLPESGATYRLTGEHYCIINGQEYREMHITEPFVF